MLSQFRKYIVVNNSGQTLTFDSNGRINLKETAWYFNTTTGKTVYAALADDDLGFVALGDLADGSEKKGDVVIDNTSNLYIGSQVQLEITHDQGTLADGTFDLYISSGDLATELEDLADGYDSAEINKLFPIGSLTWHGSGIDDEIMRSPVWNI